ncbi:hypothetical protein B9Z19DRAFT_1131370 [Tuber borchii]|uniref:Uncharacterized protein n=1 Tax=Tuber borchii TaxID=42251 RepID=A0A2T6ZIV0_TUBBO|nr:hypothetical protein B9Z19DRAFT_1131370 [Tuber borchii]
MARRITETLPLPFPAAPKNPDSILPETTIHQRQEWLQVTIDGLSLEDSHNLFKEVLEEELAHSWKKLERSAAGRKYSTDFRADMMRELEVAQNKREEERQRRDEEGRLIYDINNAEKFNKETFNAEIGYQATILFPKATKFFRKEMRGGRRLSSSNYIMYDQG